LKKASLAVVINGEMNNDIYFSKAYVYTVSIRQLYSLLGISIIHVEHNSEQ